MKLPFANLCASRDFSDWLSPVLLREMRQTVRSRSFLSTFVVIQVAMVLFVIFGIAATFDSGGDGGTGLFWSMLGFFLLLLLPLTGTSALVKESSESRLELLQLTQLHSRGIVFGKWLSLILQGLLVIVSLLPYMVLRYFLGSVNPLMDLGLLGGLVFGSMLLSAAAVCVSVVKSRSLRTILIVSSLVIVPQIITFWNVSRTMGVGGVGTMLSMNAWEWVLVVCYGFLVMSLLLEFAASRISHEAQNHETSKRLLILAGFAVILVAGVVNQDLALLLIGLQFLAVLAVCASALMHEPPRLSGVYCSLLRWRFLGPTLMYPGWPSAIGFTLLSMGIFVGVTLLFWVSEIDAMAFSLFIICICGCLFMVRAIMQVTTFERTSNLRMFLLIHVLAFCLTVLLFLFDSKAGLELKYLVCWLPHAGIFISIGYAESENWSRHFPVFLSGATVTTVISLLVCVASAFRWRQRERQLEAEARALRQTEAVPLLTPTDPGQPGGAAAIPAEPLGETSC